MRLRLARAFVYFRWLPMTCAHFGRDQICTQVKAIFSPFGHPTEVNASWLTSINLLLADEIEDNLPQNVFFLWLACTCEETCESVWPPNASLYASSTCVHLRLVASPFGQGFSVAPGWLCSLTWLTFKVSFRIAPDGGASVLQWFLLRAKRTGQRVLVAWGGPEQRRSNLDKG